MKINDPEKKLDEIIEIDLKEKLNKLKLGKAKRYFLTHIDYPQKQKQIDKDSITRDIEPLEDDISEIQGLIKEVRGFFNTIWDQDKYAAAYLLVGKALSNLEAGIFLSKKGYSEEFLELSRSGHESIDLAFLFLEAENNHLLVRWFKGEIIKNNIARQFFEKRMSKDKSFGGLISLAVMKGDIYKAYSLSTHSQYTALVDSIDIFYEDLDFYKYSGHHHSTILVYYLQSLYCNILFLLKDIFIHRLDQPNIEKADELLKRVLPTLTKDEITQTLKRYKKNNF